MVRYIHSRSHRHILAADDTDNLDMSAVADEEIDEGYEDNNDLSQPSGAARPASKDIEYDEDDIQKDSVEIDIDNNIAGHYIAQCDSCKNVFISAVTLSDQVVDSIHGMCPICNEESDQLLKWVIQDAENV